MKNLFKIFFITLFLASFSTVSANLTIEEPNKDLTEMTFNVKGKCNKDFKLDIIQEGNSILNNKIDVTCNTDNFEQKVELKNVKNGDLTIKLDDENGNTPEKKLKINIVKAEGGVPSKESLTLKNDPRVKLQGEEFETEKTKENSENKENTKDENKKAEETKKEEIIEVTLENGNKFSHRKLSCDLPQNIRENLNKELTTNFTDISNSKFVKEIKNLENLKVVVGTSKNTFENREITKTELLGLILKANCYDISTNGDWREKVLTVGLENKIIDAETFKNNKNISKKEAFEMVLKGGKIITPKINSTESMKYLGVFAENEKIEENMNLNRDEAVNTLVNILKLYRK